MDASTTHSRDDETILLLYLADELSGEQKREIDRRLASDEHFAAALNRLRDVDAWLTDSFAQLDRNYPLPGNTASWQRRIGRLIRQWHARRLTISTPVHSTIQIGGWAYAAAAVMLVIVGYTAYWGMQNDHPSLPGNTPIASIQPTSDQPAADAPADPLPDVDHQQDLASAEREIGDLAELRTSFQ